MSDDAWRARGREEIRDLVRRLVGFEWSWTEAGVEGLLAEFGWTLDFRTKATFSADAGYGMGSAEVRLAPKSDRVTVVATDVSTPHRPENQAEVNRVLDTFAMAVDAVSAELGPPGERRPGARPSVRWPVRDHTVIVAGSELAVGLKVVTREWLETEDYMATRADEVERQDFAERGGDV